MLLKKPTLSHTFILFISQFIILTSVVHAVPSTPSQDGQASSVPWFSLEWIYVNQARSRPYLETHPPIWIGTLSKAQRLAYLHTPFSLVREWKAWKTIYTKLNKVSYPVGAINKKETLPITHSQHQSLCAHWVRYEHFLALNGQSTDNKRAYLCPQLEYFINQLIKADISIFFVSAQLEQPSSAFGHIFLGIEAKDDASSYLEKPLAFTFSVPEVTDIAHVFSLFSQGGLGTYQIQDLNDLIDYYRRQEFRDVWSYRLQLTRRQKEWLLLSIWSLITVQDWYSFIEDNCAAKMAYLIALATQQFGIYTHFDRPRSPLELLQILRTHNLISEPHFVPSLPSQAEAFLVLKDHLHSDELIETEYKLVTLDIHSLEQSKEDLDHQRQRLLMALTSRSTTHPSLDRSSYPTLHIHQPDPQFSLSFPRLILKSKLDHSAQNSVLQSLMRWRGQSFAEQSVNGSLPQYSWTVLEAEHLIPLNPSLSTSILPFRRITFLDFKNRPSNLNPSWTWDLHIAYYDKAYFQLYLGDTWRSLPSITKLSSEQPSGYFDQSERFKWTTSTPSQWSYNTSVLLGFSSLTCTELNLVDSACHHRSTLDVKWHFMTNIGWISSWVIFNEWNALLHYAPGSDSYNQIHQNMWFNLAYTLYFRPTKLRPILGTTLSFLVGGQYLTPLDTVFSKTHHLSFGIQLN